ncbi:hypothetical protein [Saccharococcus caldoxylosilyticus]|uniref:hypothetical protein n=1 Tax=Saccharococcus caldoxylosilyticus TaxID=81408 RepID=UPI001FCA76A7|nr:hypothetical protein [Parageobacillus caldoxylosilyticus]BDG37507.1 hypothetical protein PcaKH15_34130 [Parageobacillus caldoxylosilyticus]BDG41298.1 hypothetical protein PcaKH16_34370 [Parageobacillus caldoxylosilyticus]
MRKIHISEAKSGDILAADIFGGNGAILLPKGAALTNQYIRSLQLKGVQYICIHDEQTDDIASRPHSSGLATNNEQSL